MQGRWESGFFQRAAPLFLLNVFPNLESCLLGGAADGGMCGKLPLGNPPFVPLEKLRTCRPIMLPGDAQLEKDEGCGGGCRKSRAALV